MKFIDTEVSEIIRLYENNRTELQKRTLFSIVSKKEETVDKKLHQHFRDFSVSNWTDYEELSCLEFEVLLVKNQPLLDDDTELIKVLGGERSDLRVYISLISNHFYLYGKKTLYNPSTDAWTFQNLDLRNHEYFYIIEQFILDMEENNFKLLPKSDALKTLPEVKTKYIDKGEVKVFHLIFTDLVTVK